ncbi:MAG: hypothetical protein LBT59_21915 [Clostridiales bacterium]|nr:hypothetical protein [Clostridiales bacterium]
MSKKKILALVFMILGLSMISACSDNIVAVNTSDTQESANTEGLEQGSPDTEGLEQEPSDTEGLEQSFMSKQLEAVKASVGRHSQAFAHSLTFGVTTNDTLAVQGKLHIEKITDDLHFVFSSVSTDAYNCKVKILLDYAETDFIVNGEVLNSYVVSVKPTDTFEIPFNLPDGISFDKPHILSVLVIPNYDKHIVDGSLVAPPISMQDIMLIPPGQDAEDFEVPAYEPIQPDKYLSLQLQGLMFNTDFEAVDAPDVKYPPKSIEVSKGETIKFAYRTGNFENSEEVLILAFLNGEPIEIDNKPYMIVQQTRGKLSYGTCEIKAPEEPGKYELLGMVTQGPFMQCLSRPFYDKSTTCTIVVN